MKRLLVLSVPEPSRNRVKPPSICGYLPNARSTFLRLGPPLHCALHLGLRLPGLFRLVSNLVILPAGDASPILLPASRTFLGQRSGYVPAAIMCLVLAPVRPAPLPGRTARGVPRARKSRGGAGHASFRLAESHLSNNGSHCTRTRSDRALHLGGQCSRPHSWCPCIAGTPHFFASERGSTRTLTLQQPAPR